MNKKQKVDLKVLEIAKNYVTALLIKRDSRSSRAIKSAEKVINIVTPAKLRALGLKPESEEFVRAVRAVRAKKTEKQKETPQKRWSPYSMFVKLKAAHVSGGLFK